MDAEHGRRRPRVSVVIPTFNEALNIEAMPDIRVVPQPGTGKGDALAAGLAACSGDVVVMLDADGSADGAEIPRFVDALLAGADLAKGSRFMDGGGSTDLTPLRRTGNRVLCGLVNLVYRTRFSDLCYGYNAGWAAPLRRLDLDCSGFEVETVMSIRSAKFGLRITEVPSFETARLFGESHLRTFRDGWRVLRAIVRERRGESATRATSPMADVLPEAAAAVVPLVDPLPDRAAVIVASTVEP
jgi:glycosyltransferase involved in cell wall biosynthesis